jgi:hypothetical protein
MSRGCGSGCLPRCRAYTYSLEKQVIEDPAQDVDVVLYFDSMAVTVGT